MKTIPFYIITIFAIGLFLACTNDDLNFDPNKKQHPVFSVHPSAGELSVNIITDDGEGQYIVRVNGFDEKVVDANDQVYFGLRKGTYEVELLGLDGSCVVLGDNPKIVNMMPKKKTSITFEISCQTGAQQIVFSSNRTGFYEIYSMNVDGTNIVQLTDYQSTTNFPLAPELSHNGSKILFTMGSVIYTMDSNGNNVQQITFLGEDSDRDSNPSWSKDGNKIVFSRLTDISEAIYIMDVDGSNINLLTEFGLDVIMPNISPDGSKVLFVRDYGMSPEGAEIHIV